MRLGTLFAGAALALVVGGAALAQTARPGPIRGTISAVDGSTLIVKTREGATAKVELGDKTAVSAVRNIDVGEIKAGSYIGTAAMPEGAGKLSALEVLVFPPQMKGVGEGQNPYNLKPKSSMTNGTVGKVTATGGGPEMTVSYKGQSATLTIPPGTPVVTFAKADRSDLKPGKAVFVFGPKGADGAVAARFVTVEKDGVKPPM
ncbi:MAG TPA: hypothetical protein VHD15_01885 [Hyphomicrobiales bacterium]|nr:hypothetical protein [Hyphomicrobiales bacterium]